MFSVSRLSYFYLVHYFCGSTNSSYNEGNGANTSGVKGEAAICGGNGVSGFVVLADKDGSGIIKGGFSITTFVFGANLLRRSLSVIGGNTRGSDTLTEVVVLVRDFRGIYLT